MPQKIKKLKIKLRNAEKDFRKIESDVKCLKVFIIGLAVTIYTLVILNF